MEKNEELKKLGEVASSWWADIIYNINATDFDNGEKGMVNMLAAINAVQSTPNQVIVEKFKDLLSKKIVSELEHKGQVILKCDYSPEGLLLETSRELNISPSVFPWKTIMWIDGENIQVRKGYSGDINEIYPEKEHTN